jgi:hypothetical protein
VKYLHALIASATLATCCGTAPVIAEEPARSAGAALDAGRMTDAAKALLESLSAEERRTVMFPLAGEARTNWSNTPPYVHPRPGLRMGALGAEQRLRVHDLLRASLSSQGYQKVAGVMRLDDVHRARTLETLAADAAPYTRAVSESFGSANYAVVIFGDPRVDTDWAWLIQGHHLGASFTVAGDRVGFTPLFLGAGPLQVDRGDDIGWSAMSYELSHAVDLIRSLTPAQRDAAISPDEVPSDVVNGVGKKRNLTKPQGLEAGDMSPAQQALLRRLVEEYVRNANTAAAEAQLAAIDAAGWESLTLSWRGALGDPASDFYYRVQGPRIVIECTHQPQHIHTIVRDPANDYGETWLALSYLEETSAADRFAAATRRAAEQ